MSERPKDIIPLIIEGLEEKKGREITVMDLSEIEGAPALYFVIAQGTSTAHVNAVADATEDFLAKRGVKPYGTDGYRNSQWIVLDYGEAIVHIFMPEFRELYNLEELWSDAKTTKVSND